MRLRTTLLSAPLALVLACGGPPPTHEPAGSSGGEAPSGEVRPTDRSLLSSSRRPSSEEVAVLDRIVDATTRVRNLPLLRPLDIRVADNAAIARHLIEGIEDEEILELVDLYVALGMLAPDDDVVAILGRVVGEQVVGFYDPELDLLVVRSDVVRGLVSGQRVDPETFVTIAHEVVHALQGQHLGLLDRMDREVDVDDDDAYQALVEGDATLSMLAVAGAVAGQPLEALLGGMPSTLDLDGGLGSSGSEELSSAPPIVRIGLTAPYVAGLRFCAALHARGGFEAIDAAHRTLPTTTEQLLHPEKFFAGESEESVSLDGLDSIEAAGYQRVREDTLGELEVAIYLGRGTARGLAPEAGEGWAGDRVRVYRRGESVAAVWALRFDTEADALEAEAAAARSDGLGPARSRARVGRDLFVVHGFDTSLREAVLATLRAGRAAR